MSNRFFKRENKSDKSNNNNINNVPTGSGTTNNNNSFEDRKAALTPLEYRVTQDRETERPFSNKYNRHWETGSYHCIVCNSELFQSSTKFESKSGWPAFYNVVDPKRVKLRADLSHIGANLLLLISKPDLARTEVSCAVCNAHLGHLFKDGPKPTGLRYCINSSSLSFLQDENNKEDGVPSSTFTASAERETNFDNSNVQEFPCNPEFSCGFPQPTKNNALHQKSQTLPTLGMGALCLNNQRPIARAKNLSQSSEAIDVNPKPFSDPPVEVVSKKEPSRSPSPPKPEPEQFPIIFEKCTGYKKQTSDENQNRNDSTRISPPKRPGGLPFFTRSSSARYPSSKGASLTAARINFFQTLDNQQQNIVEASDNSLPLAKKPPLPPPKPPSRFVSSVSAGSIGLRNGSTSNNDSIVVIGKRNNGFITRGIEKISSPPQPMKETFL